jgi:F-type H+-transporting ATPase subunit delta
MGKNVTAASLESGPVSSRYASALLDMAAKAGTVEAVEKDLAELSAMIAASADLRGFLRMPLYDRVQQKNAVAAIAEASRFQKLTASFLGILAANGRLPALESILTSFKAELIRRRGEATAKVQTAYALSPDQTKALQDQLGKAMGSHVTLAVEVNKDLLGGMVVTVGSKQIDSSVRTKLEKLKRAMTQSQAA